MSDKEKVKKPNSESLFDLFLYGFTIFIFICCILDGKRLLTDVKKTLDNDIKEWKEVLVVNTEAPTSGGVLKVETAQATTESALTDDPFAAEDEGVFDVFR